MFRRRCLVLAPTIPRSVWDPAHFNSNWSDSYSADIADRRHWPAKKWSIGLEPKTPHEWLTFSYRNLAYAYNGALRACSSFPEMLFYYNEMKQRGVKVDLDTMNVLLTRAARYEKIQVEDVFLLFDEMMHLGARPDIASVETLHTVWEHSAGMPPAWRESRRLQLVELYNHLAQEEITRLGPKHVDHLLASQMARYRKNLQLLKSSLSPSVYRMYFPVIQTADLLLKEVHNFLWEFVEPDHPAMEIPSLQMRIPFVASVLKRPKVDADSKTVKFTDFEDSDVCSVFLAAVERVVDGPFFDARVITERRVYLSLITMITASGTLYSSDLIAQLMDIVKYSDWKDSRDADAQRLLRHAVRASSAAQDGALRALWRSVEPVADARVVGRYIAARDPWSMDRICFDDNGTFKSYPSPQLVSGATADAGVDATDAEAGEEGGDAGSAKEGSGSAAKSSSSKHSAEDLELRWADIQRLIDATDAMAPNVDSERHPVQNKMEVFTGKVSFLRNLITGTRYNEGDRGSNSAASATGGRGQSSLFSLSLSMELCEKVLSLTKEVHQEMEKFMSENPGTEPELEAWEGMIIILRSIMDFCVIHHQQRGGNANSEVFNQSVEMRQALVEDCRSRFDGRMKILWLQEA